MRPATRRMFFGVALATCAAAVLFWLFHVPTDPLRPYRAVPVFSDFVSRHDHPADRLLDLAASPLAAAIAPLLGWSSDEWAAWASAPESRRWARRLADRQLVTASFTVDGSRRVWIFASRLDGRAVRLRWMMRLGLLPDFQPIGHHHGRRLWMLDAALSDAPQRLVVAFEEGLLLGCWSERPDDLRLVLDTYDRQIPAIAATDLAMRMQKDSRPDVFVWNPAPAQRLGRWYGGLERIGPDGMTGQAMWEKAPWRLPTATSANLRANSAAMFAESPCAVVYLAPALPTAIISALGAPAPIVQWLHRGQQDFDSPWTVAIFDGAFSGRLWGLRIPSLAVVFRSRAPMPARLQEIIDEINSRYGVTLLLGPVAGDRDVFSIGMADNSFYAALSIEDQAAVRTQGDWVLLASQLRVLRKLSDILQTDLEQGNENAHEPPTWAQGTFDTTRLAATLRAALSVVSLGLMMQDRERTRAIRQRIHQIQKAVQHLSGLGHIEFTVTAHKNGEPEIWFQIRPIETARPPIEAAP